LLFKNISILTMFLTKSIDMTVLYTHVIQLGQFPKMVNVEVRAAHRHNPNVKNTEWVRIRKSLEENKGRDSNEVLMITEDGFITEGTQTNFFVLNSNGTIQTAPDEQILPGTIRNIVLDICKDVGIHVILEAPNVRTISKWESVFLTSSSRLILPIQLMRFMEVDPVKEYSFSQSNSISQMQELLWKELQKRSTQLF